MLTFSALLVTNQITLKEIRCNLKKNKNPKKDFQSFNAFVFLFCYIKKKNVQKGRFMILNKERNT